jgi:hypothetical protein
MTDKDILELAENYFDYQGGWIADTEDLLKFARAIIEEHEKDREHNLGKDEYFNSWRN